MGNLLHHRLSLRAGRRRRSRSSPKSIGGTRALRSDPHESGGAMRGGCLWTLGGDPRPSVARHHQSRPNPRGGSTAQISSRSRSTIACSLSPVAPSRKVSGRASSQAAYSTCNATSSATAAPSPHAVESSGRSRLSRRHQAAVGLTVTIARLALGAGQGARALGRATSTLGFRHVTIFQGDHAACLSASFLCSARCRMFR